MTGGGLLLPQESSAPRAAQPVSSNTSTPSVHEGADAVIAQVIAQPIGVPADSVEQVLHAVRIGVSSVFGDRPAVLPREVGEQAE
jgi:CO/xanthine dehydrogenase Mo-binding subunit